MKIMRKLVPLAMLVTSACVTNGQLGESKVKPGERPALRSTEAGLWFKMDKFERRLGTSALVDRDPELNAYLRGVICKLAPEHCRDISLYILKHPYFNATMAPNGSMHVWTGLLLRVENEDQLATVLGHELAHYLNRHSIKQWNNTKAITDFLTFFTIATGGVGFGFVGLAATIGAAGSISSYSRDLETEADKEGLSLIHNAGYDTSEASRLWQRVKDEKDASDADKPSVFWATHPPTEQRIINLKKWDAELKSGSSLKQSYDFRNFDRLVKARWHEWIEDLIETRAFSETLVVIDQLQGRGFNENELSFYRGEVFRRRSDEGDLEKAKEHYEKAATQFRAPLKTYKHLGLVEKRMGKADAAIRHFEAYLEQYPASDDQELVRLYIRQLRK